MTSYSLKVTTRRASESLTKLANLMCLHDLAPVSLIVTGAGAGLDIAMVVDGERRSFDLYVARIAGLIDVDRVEA